MTDEWCRGAYSQVFQENMSGEIETDGNNAAALFINQYISDPGHKRDPSV